MAKELSPIATASVPSEFGAGMFLPWIFLLHGYLQAHHSHGDGSVGLSPKFGGSGPVFCFRKVTRRVKVSVGAV